MATESLGGSRPKNMRPKRETGTVELGFVNGSGGTLYEGQLVKLKNDGTVDVLSANHDVAIGIIAKGADDTEEVTVQTFVVCTTIGVASGGTLDENDLVTQQGGVTNTLPKWKKVEAGGGYAQGIVLAGATDTNQITVAVFRTPIPSYVGFRGIIIATSVSPVTDFGILEVGDKVLQIKVADGTVVTRTVAVAGTLPVAAIVGDAYVVIRP